jgi:hypothetical protein
MSFFTYSVSFCFLGACKCSGFEKASDKARPNFEPWNGTYRYHHPRVQCQTANQGFLASVVVLVVAPRWVLMVSTNNNKGMARQEEERAVDGNRID